MKHDEVINLLKNTGDQVLLEVEYQLPDTGNNSRISPTWYRWMEVEFQLLDTGNESSFQLSDTGNGSKILLPDTGNRFSKSACQYR